MDKIQFTPNEVKNFIMEFIKSNEILEDRGKQTLSLNIEGTHGIGKTTVTRAAVKELGYGTVKINIAQMNEPGDLIGYQKKLYEMERGSSTMWIPESTISHHLAAGYVMTGKSKTNTAPPEWVVDLKENTVVLLDDINRGNPLVLRACMELLEEKSYYGWSFPKRVTVITTSNPDSGEYNVSSTDDAENTRSAHLKMKWSAHDWAIMAEETGIDNRCINFVLNNQIIFDDEKKDGLTSSTKVVPRMMDKFFSLVSTIDSFESNLTLIRAYGESTVGSFVTSLFIKFIEKKLHRLPSPEEILSKTEEDAKTMLTSLCGNYTEDSYKAPTASIIALRLANHAVVVPLKKDKVELIGKLTCHNSFTEDLKMIIVNKLSSVKGARYSSYLMANSQLVKYMVA